MTHLRKQALEREEKKLMDRYHMIEWLDGEHGIKLMPYKIAEHIKVGILNRIGDLESEL